MLTELFFFHQSRLGCTTNAPAQRSQRSAAAWQTTCWSRGVKAAPPAATRPANAGTWEPSATPRQVAAVLARPAAAVKFQTVRFLAVTPRTQPCPLRELRAALQCTGTADQLRGARGASRPCRKRPWQPNPSAIATAPWSRLVRRKPEPSPSSLA